MRARENALLPVPLGEEIGENQVLPDLLTAH
jgi:hypothetical protein